MAENESFFRKVVRFVANPATDWAELNSRQEDSRELELEKSELKAMIERKRRNDFVRKREFDMLRRVRREGLSAEQMAALGTSSRLDDSEARAPDTNTPRQDGVKAKIDAIEQQMVGDGGFNSTRSGASSYYGNPPSTVPGALQPASRGQPRQPGTARVEPPIDDTVDDQLPALPPLPAYPPYGAAPASAPAPVMMSGGLPPLAPPSPGLASSLARLAPERPAERQPERALDKTPDRGPPVLADEAAAQLPAGFSSKAASEGVNFSSAFAVEVNEVVHDPELDEAVIAFANADFGQCEADLLRLTGYGGDRAQHAETWLVLFDLYRATGQQQRFEALAVDYAQQFGWSAPQWYSLPKLVADAQAEEPAPRAGGPREAGDIGWVCPDRLDIEAVARLRSQTLQMPLPWVLAWGGLRSMDAEAAMQLSALFRLWAVQALEIHWVAGDQLFNVLQDAAPTGMRDADPAFWLTRLEALRLANRADQFDEAAIDYCVTYEVSPPSWEPARCKVHIRSSSLSTRTPTLSVVSDVSTGFMESGLADETEGGVETAHLELSGQLVGDIGSTLAKLLGELGQASAVNVSCARLIRVDFLAAGDLLNWVLARRTENRSVQFVDAHRLVALFFGAMGINEHAKVQVRKV